MSKRFKVGFVGCGEVTQILHLPSLRELPELFETVAFCDLSSKALAAVLAGTPAAKAYRSFDEFIRDPKIDVVVIANPDAYHAEAALGAMRAGKHVLIEKPVCVTHEEIAELLEAERECGVIAQVGYMRRHAPAFIEAVQKIANCRDQITLARVHDVIGPNTAFINSTVRVVARGDDVAAELVAAAAQKKKELYHSAIGIRPEAINTAFGLLLGLASHDTSAMRELLGVPKKVLYAHCRRDGLWITAAFDYGDFICHLEVGLDQIARFDCHLEVFTPQEVLKITYDTPYIRHQPTCLTSTRALGTAGVEISTMCPTRNDSFVAEWRAFYGHLIHGTRPKCSLDDAAQDLALFREMIACLA